MQTESSHTPFGIVLHESAQQRRTDYLYRISIKCLVQNSDGDILVVKESGRSYWDLPGGGMDHGEDFKTAIAREMKEEAHMVGDFSYRIVDVDEPALLATQNFWQVRLIFAVTPVNYNFSPGEDSDEVAFVSPATLAAAGNEVSRRIGRYVESARVTCG